MKIIDIHNISTLQYFAKIANDAVEAAQQELNNIIISHRKTNGTIFGIDISENNTISFGIEIIHCGESYTEYYTLPFSAFESTDTFKAAIDEFIKDKTQAENEKSQANIKAIELRQLEYLKNKYKD